MYDDTPEQTSDEQAELAADAFAAALLMPPSWVNQAWRDGRRRVGDLANLFQVSPQAMTRRLHKLGFRNESLIRHQGAG